MARDDRRLDSRRLRPSLVGRKRSLLVFSFSVPQVEYWNLVWVSHKQLKNRFKRRLFFLSYSCKQQYFAKKENGHNKGL